MTSRAALQGDLPTIRSFVYEHKPVAAPQVFLFDESRHGFAYRHLAGMQPPSLVGAWRMFAVASSVPTTTDSSVHGPADSVAHLPHVESPLLLWRVSHVAVTIRLQWAVLDGELTVPLTLPPAADPSVVRMTLSWQHHVANPTANATGICNVMVVSCALRLHCVMCVFACLCVVVVCACVSVS